MFQRLCFILSLLIGTVLFAVVPALAQYGQIWDFDSTASGWTPWTGSTWTVHDSVYETLGDPANDFWGNSMAGKPYWTNYTLEAKVMCFPVYWDYGVIIHARFTFYSLTPLRTTCYGFWISPGQSAIGLNKYVYGVETVLIRLSEPIQTNVWYIMKLEMNNNQITCWLDGVQKFSVTDNDITSGSINIAGKGKAQFDYVKVTSSTPLQVDGDVNCDGKATVSDVVYTINYLFKGGPKPNQDCP